MNTERPRRSVNRNTYTTRSGKTIALNQSAAQRRKAKKDAAAKKKAAYLSSLPKEPWKRFLYRINPKRVAKYWFSREGGIMALKVLGIAFVVGFVVLVGVFAYFRKDLPKIKDISGNNFGGSVTYYDRTGKTVLFQDYDDRKRIPVEGTEISKYMKQATIAIEDKNFYSHGAFDTKAIIRAVVADVTGGQRQGGSTITQQLVKINEGWTNDSTITRKVKELILAVELEREYNKDDILVGYLNMAPYGNVDYGVETAAQDYFGVSAKDLTLAQSALLAGIPKAPTSFSPFSSPDYNPSLQENLFDKEATLERQHYILDLMAEQGYITKKEAEDAKAVDILAQVKQLNSHYAGIKAPYFVLAARKELRNKFPAAVVNRGGWKVITTLDMNAQKIADEQVQKGYKQVKAQGADNIAFVAEDVTTGQVVALVGGVDFNNTDFGQINYATDVNISPGSSIKPYDYSAFIDNNTNVGAGSVLMDSLGALPQYPCTNKALPKNGGNCLYDYDFKSPGPITLRYALGGSRNIPAVKAFLSSVPNDKSSGHLTSINNTMKTINKIINGSTGYRCFTPGVDVTTATKADESQCYASAAIGDGAYLHLDEHVNGISTLARGGKAVKQTYILKVTNSSGKVLTEYKEDKGTQVIKPDTAYIVSDMAADPRASYLIGSCNGETSCSGRKFHRYKGWHNAIKTGTTNDQYDGLMVSWNTKYAAGVWVGYHTRTKSYTGFAENMTDPIMKGFMQDMLDTAGTPKNWTAPSDIKTLPAYVMRSAPGTGQSVPSGSTDLFPSWYVGKTASTTSQTIDKVSGKIATSCTPSLAKSTETNSNTATWNVDVFAGGSTSSGTATATSQGNDDVHNCNDVKPTASITAVNGVGASMSTLACPMTGCTVMAYIEQGTYPFTSSDRPDFPGTVNLLVNGQTVQSVPVSSSGSIQLTYTPPSGTTTGTVTMTVQVIDSVLYDDVSDPVTVTVGP
jgi:penicillin-binding protein 1A